MSTPSRVPPEAVAAWVERTCNEQGVPLVLADPAALRRIALLLTAPRRAPGRNSGGGKSPQQGYQ